MSTGNEMNRENVEQMDAILHRQVVEIFLRHDPIGINFKVSTDEYAVKVASILPRLAEAACEQGAERIIHQELEAWFGPALTGPQAKYRDIAKEIWAARQVHS